MSSLTDRTAWRKILIYGAHGIGKTELMGSGVDVPGWSNMFILSAEKGDETLATTPRIKNKEGLFPALADNITHVAKIKEWLSAHCRYRDENNEEALKKLEAVIGMDNDGPAKRFYSLGIDSLSEIQSFCTYQAKGYGESINLDAELSKTEWDHFNTILDRMQILMRAYRDLPLHVVFLAQEQFIQDESKKMIWSPALQGQMARKVQGFVDVVGYLTKAQPDANAKPIHRLYIQPIAGGKFAAKSRVGNYPDPHIDDPSLLSMSKAFGWLNEH